MLVLLLILDFVILILNLTRKEHAAATLKPRLTTFLFSNWEHAAKEVNLFSGFIICNDCYRIIGIFWLSISLLLVTTFCISVIMFTILARNSSDVSIFISGMGSIAIVEPSCLILYFTAFIFNLIVVFGQVRLVLVAEAVHVLYNLLALIYLFEIEHKSIHLYHLKLVT